MPPSDYRMPDDFPDLTLPERTDKPPEPLRPLTPASAPISVPVSAAPWHEGDPVFAPWEPDFLYAGRIAQIKDSQALIEFGDGDAGWVLLNQLRPRALTKGQHVFSRRKMGGIFFAASVRELRGEQVCLDFEDGDEETWVSVAAVRIPCAPTGRGAAPVKTASHLAFYAGLAPGERVWAPWNAGVLYVGTVDEVRDREVHIRFDDGGCGWVNLEQILPLQLPVGLRVLGRWRMGAAYYPGTVDQVDGERIHIQ